MHYEGENAESIISQKLRIAQKNHCINDCQINPDISYELGHF